MDQTDHQAALFAPHELIALFSSTRGELSFSPDSLRYLGVLEPDADQAISAA